jgi:hypothetical protein
MAVITLVEEIRCALHLALVTSTLEVELAWILEERQGAAFSIETAQLRADEFATEMEIDFLLCCRITLEVAFGTNIAVRPSKARDALAEAGSILA